VLPDIETDRSAHADGINQPLLPLTRSLPREGVLKLLCLVRMMKLKIILVPHAKETCMHKLSYIHFTVYNLGSF
jgi:hypothetical protein